MGMRQSPKKPTRGFVKSGLETEHPVVGIQDPATYILRHHDSHRHREKMKKYITHLNMIEGSHFHSLDEYLEIKD